MSYRNFFDLLPRKDSEVMLRDIYSCLVAELPVQYQSIFLVWDVVRDASAISGYDETRHFAEWRVYFVVRAIKALCEKNADIPRADLPLTRRQAALKKFIISERICAITNRRFRAPHSDETFVGAAPMLYRMQRKISEVLGDAPSVDKLKMRFGPGANSNVRRKTSARYKLNAHPSCSREAESLFSTIQNNYPHWLQGLEPEVQMGELTTVPKNAETDRCIIIEPILNTALQLPVGQYMKRRLSLFGIDLLDQNRNRNLAKEASISGRYVTLDLSSASDLIASRVVAELLPAPWVELLTQLRTGRVTVREVPGGWLELEKFSSMGNGFTFELETLIFFSACCAVYEEAGLPVHDLSVYGDDIIVRTEVAQRLIDLLTYLGFRINTEKSCLSGPFRESCGGDYLNGINVRPFYVKDRMTYARLVALINHYLNGVDCQIGYGLLSRLIGYLPKRHRLFGPVGFGSGHINVPNLRLPPFKRDKGLSGYAFKTYTQTPRSSKEPLSRGDRLYPLYSQYMREPENLDVALWNNLLQMADPGILKVWNFRDAVKAHEILADNIGRSDDPYVVRGAWKARAVRIYCLSYEYGYAVFDPSIKAIRRKRKREQYLQRCRTKVH